MKRKMGLFMLVFMLVLAVAGCNSDKAGNTEKDTEKKEEPKVEQTSVKPKPIDEAVDKCENCKMAVADNADATEIVLKDGKTLVFDDIGCMHKWMIANGEDDIEMAFVRSHHDKEWLDYEKAVYVFDPKITTAMGYGVIAFKDEAGAKNFIEKNGMGTIMTKEELDKHDWPQDKSNMTMKKHMDGEKQQGDSHSMNDMDM
jgi:copper chaperone NosL